jgi:hypothetical protein
MGRRQALLNSEQIDWRRCCSRAPRLALHLAVKLLVRDYDNNCTFPDDLIGHLFDPEDFDGSFGDLNVCNYIDQAPLAEVQLLLMDVVMSEQLSAGPDEVT